MQDNSSNKSLAEVLGRGKFRSIRQRVEEDLREHGETNVRIKQMRYPWLLRVVRAVFCERPIWLFLTVYLGLDVFLVVAEAVVLACWPGVASFWINEMMKGLLKDSAGFLISAQVGLVGVASVAIALITLIAQSNNRSSDIELYYAESLSHEVTRSSVALLIVLVLQVYWPFQFLMHLAGLGSPSLVFKVLLTGFHAVWLCMNLAIFAHFMLSSLRFVQRSERTKMREIWTIRVIQPPILRESLMGYYLRMVGDRLTLRKGQTADHWLLMGRRPTDQEAQEEIKSNFRRRSVLHDLRLVPLESALNSFRKRSSDPTAAIDHRRRRRGQNDTTIWLTPSQGGKLEGQVVWCYRSGGVPLSPDEQEQLRRAVVFRRMSNRDEKSLITPAAILQELAVEVVEQISDKALVGFRRAWGEMTDYHQFLIEIHNTQDESGNVLSFAQIGSGWIPPYQDWNSQYRTPVERAIDIFDTDPEFAARVVRLPYYLMPDNAVPVAAPVIASLLDTLLIIVTVLGRRMVVLTPEPEGAAAAKPVLSKAQQRHHLDTIHSLIEAWEGMLKLNKFYYDLEEIQPSPAEMRWKKLRQSWPFLRRHLLNTAFCVASAVWHEDDVAADKFCGTLLLWLSSARLDPGVDYFLQREWLLLPWCIDAEWPGVEKALTAFVTHSHPLDPDTIFDEIVGAVFNDSLLVVAALLLRWHHAQPRCSDIPARIIKRLLSRQLDNPSFGQRNADAHRHRSNFLRVLFMVVRSNIGWRSESGSYAGYLNEVIGWIGRVGESTEVPGRPYATNFPDIGLLRKELLSLMIVTIGGDDPKQALAEIEAIAGNLSYLPDGEASLQRVLHHFQSLLGEFDQEDQREDIKETAQVVSPDRDLEPGIALVVETLNQCISSITKHQEVRLRDTPLDAGIMEELRSKFEVELGFLARRLHWLNGVKVESGPGGKEIAEILKFYDRGNLTAPPITSLPVNFWESATGQFAAHIGFRAAFEFFNRPRTPENVPSLDGEEFWNRVKGHARGMRKPGLIITQSQAVQTWNWYNIDDRKPDFVDKLYRSEDRAGTGGNGVGYVMSADGIDIFLADLPDGHALLFDSAMLEGITVTPFDNGHLVEVDFSHGEDLHQGWIVAKYQIAIKWTDGPLIDFKVEEPKAEDAP